MESQARLHRLELGDFPVKVDFHRGGALCAKALKYHPEPEVHLVCRGRIRYLVDGVPYDLQRNHVLLIRSNEVHTRVPNTDSDVKKFGLVFSPGVLDGSIVASQVLSRLWEARVLQLTEEESTEAEFLLQSISAEYLRRGIYWQAAITGFLEKFLILLERARTSDDRRAHAENTTVRNESPLIQEVIRHLEEHFADGPTLVGVASKFNISPYSLSRMFKRFVGLGYKEYVIHRRILEAKKLLQQTDMKIATVASKVGFEDLSTFNRNFIKLTGVTPSTYRKFCI